ncbi:Uncharacterised protein [Vibrio cholerae]|uniref:Uncharacterized protein n=2 Tax=Vibrio cholerae TaxID=666 RepID=A0A655UYT1_VIBCL|nr:Uncharacterised protein [Vibrio cholerae]CSB24056.1 Uncharacterised protein [Vibrio cholerae]CSB58969.1 Uncharacterised protein [Vibrio cholerae]CSD04128.1 Uncharacterised protein [Vibrio cholerae]
MAFSPCFEVISICTTLSTITQPAETRSPAVNSTGKDSPVNALLSRLAAASKRPSAGKRPPGATSMTSPGCNCAAGTVTRSPCSIRIAVSGTSAIKACTPVRAREAA